MFWYREVMKSRCLEISILLACSGYVEKVKIPTLKFYLWTFSYFYEFHKIQLFTGLALLGQQTSASKYRDIPISLDIGISWYFEALVWCPRRANPKTTGTLCCSLVLQLYWIFHNWAIRWRNTVLEFCKVLLLKSFEPSNYIPLKRPLWNSSLNLTHGLFKRSF